MQEIVCETNTDDGDMRCDAAHAVGAPAGRCLVRVDFSERNAALLDLARRSGEFDARMEHLTVGDRFIGGGIIVERRPTLISMVSLAVMWRLPVLCARDPEDSLRILCFLAHQLGNSDQRILRRYDRKP